MTQPATTTIAPQTPLVLASFGVLVASVGFGLVPFFSRGLMDQGLAPHAIAFYRYVLAAIILLPVLLRHLRSWPTILWGMGAGVVMGLGWIGYVRALSSAPASTVGVLYMTYPVFTIALAWLLFGDRPTRRGMLAAALTLVAAVVATSPAAVSPDQIPVLLASLSAPASFGLGICVLVHRLSRVPALVRIASVCFGSVLGLAPLMLTSSAAEVLPANAQDWILIAGIAIVTAFVPQLIYTVCSPMIGATRTAVIGSVELPTMFAVALIAFGEPVTLAQALACGLILSAILLTQSRATRNVSTTLTKS